MSNIFSIVVATRNPSGRPGDMGECEEGYYTISNGLLTIADLDGRPVRDSNGEQVTAPVREGEARAVASRLILARWRMLDAASDFNRPINYSAGGWA